MKNQFIFIIAFFFIFFQISCSKKKESKINFKDFEINLSKDEEPPLILEVKSKNDIQYFVENQSKKWQGIAKDSETIISVYDWKLFPHNNIAFEYPRTYSFEADLTTTSNIWTLSGNDFKIMIISLKKSISVKEYVDGMVSQFGLSNCSTKKITKQINSYDLDGMSLLVSLTGVNLEMEIFEVVDTNGKSSLLVFQDSLTDEKDNSKESKKTMRKIDQTFKVY